VFGPLISGFINQHVSWRWTWWVDLIWASSQYLFLVIFVPETYTPALLKRKARRLRKQTGDNRYVSTLDKDDRTILQVIGVSCTRPFGEQSLLPCLLATGEANNVFLAPELLSTEPMAFLLCLWTALLLGILYGFFS
jgi:MFS family permease